MVLHHQIQAHFIRRHIIMHCIAFLAMLSLSGCSSAPYIVPSSAPYDGEGTHQIYLVSNHWHTGIVVPADLILLRLPELKTRFPNAQRFEFGWGDQGFYQSKEITTGITLQAIFWPTQAVMHVVEVPREVQLYFPESEVLVFSLDDQALNQLLTFIELSFSRNEQQQLIASTQGIYGNSQFYFANGDYYLMNTCNKWTAKGMVSIGMDFSPIFMLTAGNVIDAVQEQPQVRNISKKNNSTTIFSPGKSSSQAMGPV